MERKKRGACILLALSTLPGTAFACELHEIWQASGGSIELIINENTLTDPALVLHPSGDSVLSRETRVDGSRAYAIEGRALEAAQVKMSGDRFDYLVSARFALDLGLSIADSDTLPFVNGLKMAYQPGERNTFLITDEKGMVWFELEHSGVSFDPSKSLVRIDNGVLRPGWAFQQSFDVQGDLELGRMNIRLPLNSGSMAGEMTKVEY